MNIYSIHNGVLIYRYPALFKHEKEMQKLIENNLTSVSDLELVKSEFWIRNKRIDTLAFNRRLMTFVIIEYKRDRNYSVIDQGIYYLKLLHENKSDCLVKYNEKFGSTAPISKDDVNWNKTCIIFASPDFTEHQINAACYKDLRIILWLVSLYGNSILTITEIKNKKQSADFISKYMPVTEIFGETKKSQDLSNDPFWNKIKILGNRT